MQIELRPKPTIILLCITLALFAGYYFLSRTQIIATQISLLTKYSDMVKGELDADLDELRAKRDNPTDPTCVIYSGVDRRLMAQILIGKYISGEDHRALRNTITPYEGLFVPGKKGNKEGYIYIDFSKINPTSGGVIEISGAYKDFAGKINYITRQCMIDFDPPKRIEFRPIFTDEQIQAMHGPIATGFQ